MDTALAAAKKNHEGVVMRRINTDEYRFTLTDLLDCDRLDLQFRKKTSETPGANDKEIDFAIATANADAVVELHLEGEEMHAFGVEMQYFAPVPKNGPRTIIKGSPMHALRQGHQIQCEELHLKGADKEGNGQESFAKGPGKMDLFDKQKGRSTTHITFKNSFTSAKDKDGDRVYDLLTLKGDVSCIDDEHKQELHAAQFLHVWLDLLNHSSAEAPAHRYEPCKPCVPRRNRPA